MKKEKEHLILHLSEFQSKSFHLHHYQQFLKEHDDKLIQKSVKIFKKKIAYLEEKTEFCCFSE